MQMQNERMGRKNLKEIDMTWYKGKETNKA